MSKSTGDVLSCSNTFLPWSTSTGHLAAAATATELHQAAKQGKHEVRPEY